MAQKQKKPLKTNLKLKHLYPWSFISLAWLFLCGVIAQGFILANLFTFTDQPINLEILNPIIGSVSFGIGSMLVASILGTTLAIYFECYQRDKSPLLKYLFALPLAFPIYVFSFIYVGAFEYSSFLSTSFRSIGLDLPSVRNILGASLITGLCLYPYVFLIVTAHLRVVFPKYYWVSKSLGLNDLQTIVKVLLPALAPSILAGAMLVLFESLADFGAVKTFGIETLTTSIYSQWFGMQDYIGGSRLALILLAVVVGFIYLQKLLSKETNIQKIKTTSNIALISGSKILGAAVLVIGFFAIAFPFAQLILWAEPMQVIKEFWVNNIFLNSLLLAFVGGLLVLILGLAIAFANLQKSKYNRFVNLTTYGYALPGSVIAVAIMVGFQISFDISLTDLGLIGLILALSIRFLTPAKNYATRSLSLIPKSSIYSLALHNSGSIKSFTEFYWKHIRLTSLLVFFIVAIEILKEQPAVLLLRPAGFDTLSSRIYNYTSEGQWELAAQPSILLVFIGVIFVIMLTRIQDHYE